MNTILPIRRTPAALLLIFLTGIFFSAVIESQAADYKRLIIRNVRMIDPAEKTEDKVVTILIEDKKLSLVTEDPIARQDMDLVVDADKGVLMGRLKLGESASFMIFAEDPREDFKVMLDTNKYAVFAIHEGEIYRNNFTIKDDTAPDVKGE